MVLLFETGFEVQLSGRRWREVVRVRRRVGRNEMELGGGGIADGASTALRFHGVERPHAPGDLFAPVSGTASLEHLPSYRESSRQI